MRTHKQLVLYQSILQVLQESGCPFCRFLKEYQTARLQNHPKESIHRLCNFHAWGLAAVQDAPAAALTRTDVSQWLRSSAVLCIPHGEKLRRQVPPVLAVRVDAIIENYRRQLAQDLQHLRDEPEPERAGWGALGRAAEFLVSQRGLHS